jgi:hypothetical protein
MEIIVEKLKLLDYERDFCQQKRPPWQGRMNRPSPSLPPRLTPHALSWMTSQASRVAALVETRVCDAARRSVCTGTI